MVPTQDQVKHVAKLARLHLSEEEIGVYQAQLAGIFGYIDMLSEVDISGVTHAYHASRDQMVLRPDEVEIHDDPQKLLAATEQEVIGNHIAITNIMKHT